MFEASVNSDLHCDVSTNEKQFSVMHFDWALVVEDLICGCATWVSSITVSAVGSSTAVLYVGVDLLLDDAA